MHEILKVRGKVAHGHGVASGQAKDNPFGKGTIELQSPFFEQAGIPMWKYHSATINVDISPHTFDLIEWDYEARKVHWTDVIPPEDFYFSHCQILQNGKTHEALVYRPSPATKVGHFQAPQIVEILAAHIEGLTYGDTVELGLNPGHCSVA